MSNRSATRIALPGRRAESVWVVVLTGVALALVGAWQISLDSMAGSGVQLGFVIFIDVGLPLVAVGIVLYVKRASRIPDGPIARWAFAGIVALLLLAVWASSTELRDGRFIDALGTLVLGANPGILFGVVAGINRAQAKENAEVLYAQSADPRATDDEDHLAYHERNRRRDRLPGALRIRVRYRQCVTPWFDYLMASPEEMRELVADTPWTLEAVLGEDDGYVGVLEL